MSAGEGVESVRAEITYDDGQNVFLDGMKSCPWCGKQEDEHMQPFVQVGPTWGDGEMDARVVCPVCHVSTARVSARKVTSLASGEDVTRYAAIGRARAGWNALKVDACALSSLADELELVCEDVCGTAAFHLMDAAEKIRHAIGAS